MCTVLKISSSTYTKFKPHVPKYNEESIENVLNGNFHDRPKHQAVVSDLIYVRVGKYWNYIRVLVDLFNREIIGYSAGKNKNSNLVMQVFPKVKINLKRIQIFHTNRGNEFKNQQIDERLKEFKIERSLSMEAVLITMQLRK